MRLQLVPVQKSARLMSKTPHKVRHQEVQRLSLESRRINMCRWLSQAAEWARNGLPQDLHIPQPPCLADIPSLRSSSNVSSPGLDSLFRTTFFLGLFVPAPSSFCMQFVCLGACHVGCDSAGPQASLHMPGALSQWQADTDLLPVRSSCLLAGMSGLSLQPALMSCQRASLMGCLAGFRPQC